MHSVSLRFNHILLFMKIKSMRFHFSVCVRVLLIMASLQLSAQGYNIKIKIKGTLPGDTILLANYYGNKQYVKDSAFVDAKSTVVFSGKEALPGGLYMVVIPGKTYFEIIGNEPQFSLETDTIDFINTMKVTGSPENQVFYDFLRFSTQRQMKMQQYSKDFQRVKDEGPVDSMEVYQNLYLELDKEVNEYKEKLFQNHPEKLVSKIFKAMKDPVVPDPPKMEDGSIDSFFQYRYFKDHFFDNMDLQDDRLLRSPVFHNRLNYFFTKLIPQIPDTIIKEGDRIVKMTGDNKETFKYVVFYITTTFETAEIMGMDAVFTHMANTYYRTGQAYWVDSTQLNKILDRADILGPLLLGKTAPNLTLPDSLNKPHTLHDIKAKHTVLVFWDPSCGHCKTTLPKLYALYDSIRTKSIEVYAVCVENDLGKWKEFIREKNLDWINVSILEPSWEAYQKFYTNNNLDYNRDKYLIDQMNLKRPYYDITSTPVIYLLDENKKIVAKRLDVDNLRELLKIRVGKDLFD